MHKVSNKPQTFSRCHYQFQKRIQISNTVIYIFNIRIIICNLNDAYSKKKRWEMCIYFNIEISKVEHCTWIHFLERKGEGQLLLETQEYFFT